MHDEHPHPLLAQVPLTLSPFLSLPTAVPLPYSYKTLPSTLPPSILQTTLVNTSEMSSQQDQQSPAYVISASGTSASPDTILASCVALQQHLQKLEDDARRVLADWEEKGRKEDLAEKRRVAPGWLDSGVHILKPENVGESGAAGAGAGAGGSASQGTDRMDVDSARQGNLEGEELDRVFGDLKV